MIPQPIRTVHRPIKKSVRSPYGSCLNEAAVNRKPDYIAPSKPHWRRIQSLSSSKADLHPPKSPENFHDQGVDSFFRFNSTPDSDDARMTIADVDQGGLGLPDKSYYLEEKDGGEARKYVCSHLAHISADWHFSRLKRTARRKPFSRLKYRWREGVALTGQRAGIRIFYITR